MGLSPDQIPAGHLVPGGTRRDRVEARVEFHLDAAHRLIALLDAADGEPCLEVEERDGAVAEWIGRGAHRFDAGGRA